MEYRREIDGLRAVAVIPVIFFHAGFEGFSGGFVGVDIFFVISGYLITSIILAEKEQGKFSIINFYDRRARRILPALFFVMLASLPFAWIWLLPTDLKDFSQSLIAVSFFISNFLFWQESGYFATASELKPLLHTWSLAVEEQYYVFFPLFLMLIWWLRKRWILGTIVFIGIVSLSLSQWGAFHKPTATFFLLPTRAWELMIGASAAFFLLYGTNNKDLVSNNKLVSEWLSVIGLILICYSTIFFDEKIPFPSVYALVPTVGTALIILFSSSDTVVGKLLSTKILVGIGLISYSAYLWHQPLFVFARHRSLNSSEYWLFTLLILATFILAYLSWRYIEKPFRNKKSISRKNIFVFAVVSSLFFISVGLLGDYNNGFPGRLSTDERNLLAFKQYEKEAIYREGDCFLQQEQTYKDFSNSCSDLKDKGDELFLWGDSHAAALSFGLRHQYNNVIQFNASGCPPIKGFHNPTRVHCKKIIEHVFKKIADIKPKYIVLHANWLYALRFINSIDMSETIAYINNISPESKVYVIGGVPQWQPSLPTVLFRKQISLSDEVFLRMAKDTEERLLETDKLINSKIVSKNVTFISPYNLLCDQKGCLVYVKYGDKKMPTAWDSGHLTENGSLLLAEKLIEQLM